MMGTTGATVRASFMILAAAGSRAFSPSFPVPTRFSGTTQQAPRSSALMTPCMGMFGFGGGRSSAPSSSGDGSGSPSPSKARKAVESSAVFKSRTEQVCLLLQSVGSVDFREVHSSQPKVSTILIRSST